MDVLALLNESPAATYATDIGAEPRLIFASAAVETLLGFPPSTFVDNPGFLTGRVHPEDVAGIASGYRAALSGQTVRSDRRIKIHSGDYRWFRDTFRVVRDDKGDPLYGVGTIFDVTEEKAAERALEQSSAEYRVLAERSSDLISRIGVDGRILYQSPASQRAFGRFDQMSYAVASTAVMHPHDRTTFDETRAQVIATGQAKTASYRARTIDGRWLTFESVLNPVIDPATGTVTEFVTISRDVTAKHAAEAALAEARTRIAQQGELYELFASRGSEVFLRFDARGHLTHVSPSCERILGLSASADDAQLSSRIHPDDRLAVAKAFERAAGSGSPCTYRHRFLKAEGEWIWLEATMTPLVQEGSSVVDEFIAVARDVTAQTRSEHALADARRDAEERAHQLALITDSSADIFIRHAPDGSVKYISSAVTRVLGYSIGRIEQSGLADVVLDEDRPSILGAFDACVATGREQEVRFRCRHRSGQHIWLEARMSPVPGIDGGLEIISVCRDISGRVDNERRLQATTSELSETAQRLNLLSQNIADAIITIDRDGTITSAAGAISHIYGIEAADLVGAGHEIFHPDDVEIARTAIETFHRTKASVAYRLRQRTGKGDYIWVEHRANPVFEPQTGKLLACVVTVRDIDDQVHRDYELAAARKELDESRAKLELVTDNMADIVSLFRPDGSVAYMSPSTASVIGYTVAELSSKKFGTLSHPDFHELLFAEAARNRQGEVTPIIRYRIRHRDGRWIWVERRASAVLDHDFGPGVAVLSTIRDVSEQVAQENEVEAATAALEESRARLQNIMDNSIDVIAVFDANRQMLYLSKSCEQQSGYTVQEFIDGKASLSHPDDEAIVNAALARENAGGEGETFRYRGIRKDGAIIWLERRARKVYDTTSGELASIITVTRDISEDVRSEQRLAAAAVQLEKSKIAAESASVAKSQFLATMSHELRTPMTGVMGMLDLLKGSTLSGEQSRFVNLAYDSAENLLTILNDILDFSKIEAGQMAVDLEPFSLRGEIDKVMSLLTPVANKKGNVLEAIVDESLPQKIRGDAARVRQVLFNLVGNANKFTDEGRVRVEVAVRGTSMLRFGVRDSGIGIAPDAQEKLFRPFVQVDGSASRKAGGTGLGLAICKSLVQAMGGEIGLESVEGRGSLFWFDLPLRPVDEASAADAKTAAMTQAVQRPRRRFDILVAEDHPVNQQLISALLKREGHRATIVANGRLAVEAVQSRVFDLILMDVQMPVLDGPGATREIRALPSAAAAIPIVAITANALRGDMESYLEIGMNGYVSKPIRIDALREAMEQAVPHRDDEERLAG